MKFTNRKEFLRALNPLIQEGWFITDICFEDSGSTTRVMLISQSTQLRYELVHYKDTELYLQSSLEGFKRDPAANFLANTRN
jgi:hypothetical protein